MIRERARPTTTRVVLAIKLFFILCLPPRFQGYITLMRGGYLKFGGTSKSRIALLCCSYLSPAGRKQEICSYPRSEEHTSELQSRFDLVCRLLLEKKKKKI